MSVRLSGVCLGPLIVVIIFFLIDGEINAGATGYMISCWFTAAVAILSSRGGENMKG